MTTRSSSDGGLEGSSRPFKGWFERRKHDGRFEYIEERIAEGKAKDRPTDFWERMLEKHRRKDAIIRKIAREHLHLYHDVFAEFRQAETLVEAAGSEEDALRFYRFLLEPIRDRFQEAFGSWKWAVETSLRAAGIPKHDLPWVLSSVEEECKELFLAENAT